MNPELMGALQALAADRGLPVDPLLAPLAQSPGLALNPT